MLNSNIIQSFLTFCCAKNNYPVNSLGGLTRVFQDFVNLRFLCSLPLPLNVDLEDGTQSEGAVY